MVRRASVGSLGLLARTGCQKRASLRRAKRSRRSEAVDLQSRDRVRPHQKGAPPSHRPSPATRFQAPRGQADSKRGAFGTLAPLESSPRARLPDWWSPGADPTTSLSRPQSSHRPGSDRPKDRHWKSRAPPMALGLRVGGVAGRSPHPHRRVEPSARARSTDTARRWAGPRAASRRSYRWRYRPRIQSSWTPQFGEFRTL